MDAPQRKNYYTQDEYFGISNYVFNFNFLAIAVSKILGGPKITLEAYALWTPPSGDFFCSESEYFPISSSV